MISNKDGKRKVITFCGSSRFHDLFHKLASEYELIESNSALASINSFSVFARIYILGKIC